MKEEKRIEKRKGEFNSIKYSSFSFNDSSPEKKEEKGKMKKKDQKSKEEKKISELEIKRIEKEIFFRGGRDLRKSIKSKSYNLFLEGKDWREIRKILKNKMKENSIKSWIHEWKKGENIPLSHRINLDEIIKGKK